MPPLKGQPIVAAVQTREVVVEPIAATDGLLSTVRNVELCATGIEYPLASGPTSFTEEDLVQVVASQDDPAIQAPRVWLGHPDDQRFHAGRTTPAGSAEPALGKVINMRVEEQGQVLVGDIAGCPTWLANILASAYPNRSVEGFKGAQTATGRQWDMVITDLALLGVTWPGVSTLADLEDLYSEEGPEGIEVEEMEPIAAAARVTAQADLDKIRRAFVANLEELKIPGWPWIRAILQDPNELIVDDDEGGLYRVAYSASADTVTFGEPKQVKVEYVNASQAKDPDARGLLVNMLTRDANIVASWDQRAASRPDTNNQETNGMNPEQIKLLRARLGLTEEQLPDDASQDQITAALTPPSADPSGAPGDVTQTSTAGANTSDNPSPDQLPNPDDDVANVGTGNPGPGPVSASQAQLPEGYVAVPADAWAQVQANAQAGAQVAQQSENQRREGIIASAVKQGRIAPSQAENFRKMFGTDASGAETLLTASVDKGGLMPGTIPVEARGADPVASDMSQEAYPSDWLPELSTDASASPITMEV